MSLSKIINPTIIDSYVNFWVSEDIPNFDLSTLVVENDSIGKARIDLKEDCVLAGYPFCEAVAKRFNCDIEWYFKEGEFVKGNVMIGLIKGTVHSLLMIERTVLNILSRASGVATTANKMKVLLKNWKGEVTGNRKTTPGFRIVEKYSMYVGGIGTHRYDLSSMIILKDNHLKSSGGSIEDALKNVRKMTGKNFTKVEVEVSTAEEALKAVKAGADIIMLDNFKSQDVKSVSKQIKDIDKSVLIEASGGINETNIKDYAVDHVDIISSSQFCQGYKCIDVSINFLITENNSSITKPAEIVGVSDKTCDKSMWRSNSDLKESLNGDKVSDNSSSTKDDSLDKSVNIDKSKTDLKRKAEEIPESKKTTSEPQSKVERKQKQIESPKKPITPVQNTKMANKQGSGNYSSNINNSNMHNRRRASPAERRGLNESPFGGGYKNNRFNQQLPQPRQVQVGMPVRMPTINQNGPPAGAGGIGILRGNPLGNAGATFTIPGGPPSMMASSLCPPPNTINSLRFGGPISMSASPRVTGNIINTKSVAAGLTRPSSEQYWCRNCRFQNQLGGPPFCQKCRNSLI